MRVVITRPKAQATAWVERLHALGVDAVALPLLTIAPAADADAVQRAWQELPGCALVVFVSPNAVQALFAHAPVPAGSPARSPARWPAGTLAASTGPGTSAALRAAGVPPQQLVEPAADAASFDSEALWAQIGSRPWRGQRVLVVRGDQGRDWLATMLREQGAEVGFVAAYRRVDTQLDDDARRLLHQACSEPALHLWHFSSSAAVHTLRLLAPQQRWGQSRAVATHPRIVEAAREAGFGQVERVGVRAEDVAQRLHEAARDPASEAARR